mmetsp:Transcript_13057/g.27585  ORF Transcript_13057/g.27585 Transcript_13057/m.27585 type:complete len:230 (+) Transcript_13057:694-1383(+)
MGRWGCGGAVHHTDAVQRTCNLSNAVQSGPLSLSLAGSDSHAVVSAAVRSKCQGSTLPTRAPEKWNSDCQMSYEKAASFRWFSASYLFSRWYRLSATENSCIISVSDPDPRLSVSLSSLKNADQNPDTRESLCPCEEHIENRAKSGCIAEGRRMNSSKPPLRQQFSRLITGRFFRLADVGDDDGGASAWRANLICVAYKRLRWLDWPSVATKSYMSVALFCPSSAPGAG